MAPKQTYRTQQLFLAARIVLPSALLLFTLYAGRANAVDAAIQKSDPPAGSNMPFLGGFLKETRIVYPLSVGDWKSQKENRFEDQEYGVSIRYTNDAFKDRWIDIYIYPAGALSDAEFQQVAEQTAAGLKIAAEQRGDTEGFDMGKLTSLPIPLSSGAEDTKVTVPARVVSLHMKNDGVAYNSAMAIALHRLYFIKGRYSAEEASLPRDAVEKLLQTFFAEFVRKNTINSSGDCWSQLPIVQKLAPPNQDSGGQMANATDKEDSASAVLYQDRVEAKDPGSDEAKALQVLGMAMTGRLSEGCGPAEDLDRAVPDGMREIRVEYRAP